MINLCALGFILFIEVHNVDGCGQVGGEQLKLKQTS